MTELFPNYVTALATLGLLAATVVLAIFTKRLTDSSSSPQVIAVLQSSRWSMMHVDLVIENTGNATAFDIIVTFDPPLVAEKTGYKDPQPAPFDQLSVLKPTQALTSFIGEARAYLENTYQVTISWTRKPGDEKGRKSLSYQCDLSYLQRASTLGPGDPASATANELKKIREGIVPFFKGRQKASIDVYSQSDRERIVAKHQENFEAMQAKKKSDGEE